MNNDFVSIRGLTLPRRMILQGTASLLGCALRAHPDVVIGSYPFFDPQHGPTTNVVLHAHDAHKLARAKRAVEDMLEHVRGAQSSSA